MSKQNRETLIRWYRERIQDLTTRIEEAFMEDLALDTLKSWKRCEAVSKNFLNEGNANDKNDEP